MVGSKLVLFILEVALLATSSVEYLSLTFQRYVYVCVCVCVCVCYASVCVIMNMHACMYVCMYVRSTYIHTYLYISLCTYDCY